MADLTHEDWLAAADRLTPETRPFLGRRHVESTSDETFPSVSPRDGRVLAQIPAGSAEDVDRAVRAARESFEDGRWRDLPPRERKRILLRWADAITAHTAELALLDTLEMGKPISESQRVDVAKTAETIAWYAETIDKTYDELAPTPGDALAWITREPLGVIGAVVPWNYALLIASWKLGPALATGNSVVLKPAEQTSLAALLLARLATEAGLPDGVLNVVPGRGEVVGQALGRHPGVDKIAFTGSAEVARLFQVYAGESNGKQVAVEAGGKSPQLILPDADLSAAASAVAWGIFYNAGQTCNAGSRVIVPAALKDELLAELAKITEETFRPGDPLDPATVLGPLVDDVQRDRVLGYLDAARAEGGTIVLGGRCEGLAMEPTIVDDVRPGTTIEREEVFGPVLAVLTYDGSPEEGVRLANDTDFGLVASVWTRDVTTAHRVAKRLRAGTVWINTFDASDVITPFGGFKATGAGRDKSLHALDAYTALKTTWLNLPET
ncbi:gamma-glutamyl-gamma-aminobutyraldehyde dehydrogenase [Amycolatopsis mediterranei S699]|uniref:Gamma-glutamyl-gamma-aminobutyraldehyde dehydrogenase n=2 Tax=Amycolatopsis mediterranei TaxID=33910 RepID=A0A0H3DD12_AMYMU|nr:aldehyde dehydrogenase family protein [Amycolatopsis mediterranei]ADJ47943.1 gamma-glutamyl-gamma-aminobutyraldehyde dehydrogenase [Amycolatopsis mediterranei U32]AEK44843.1 gamma-glutamyl-gamma-aminobutyraldehyde dehydrogenase [Amycolatopsis mediterranei S699]AFO79654.1 gamma-glutamyl-gamma-aminobutyraldehyde dehydrogenase [Amycolatopsis mediterranei S699]AGT86782.1 gamma-glutamyl-gamma-aminobutyraldehyde dehydrogenase [Amycolatopsis mediterranei RB]KDO10764.1 aldehyde dehydrogenase [Amyco